MPNFKGSPRVDQALASEQLAANLHAFVNWSMLAAGGFGDASGDAALLRPSDDPAWSGRAWEGRRKQWTWEPWVDFERQPIVVSGVWVDDVFRPGTGVGPHSHRVDYENGRVVFDSPIAPSSVRCDHSYRLAQVYAADSPWARHLQAAADQDDLGFFVEGSGAWSVPPELRAQPPAVVVEVLPRASRSPYELGSMEQYLVQEALLHVLATPRSTNAAMWLHDALVGQDEHVLVAFDKNRAARSGVLPLTPWGDRNPNGLSYPELASLDNGWAWRRTRIARAASEPAPTIGGVSHAVVRWSCETILP